LQDTHVNERSRVGALTRMAGTASQFPLVHSRNGASFAQNVWLYQLCRPCPVQKIGWKIT
jgi:hypothetical protein